MYKRKDTDHQNAEIVRRSGSIFLQYGGSIPAPAHRGKVRTTALRVLLQQFKRFDRLMGDGKQCTCENHQLDVLYAALAAYKINGRREFFHDARTNAWHCLSILLYRATGPQRDLSLEQVIAIIQGGKAHNTENIERNRSQAKWKTTLINELRAGKVFPKPDYDEGQQTLFAS